MSVFMVDQEKCKRDGLCVSECPMRVIEISEPEVLPSMMDGGDKVCITCGHCVAVCPHSACRLDDMGPDDCAPVRKELLPSAEQTGHFLRTRRSVRVYKDTPVPKEVLAQLIDIARYAPSGHNDQPLNWIVISDPRELEQIKSSIVECLRGVVQAMPDLAASFNFGYLVSSWDRGEDAILRGAPHLIVAHADKAMLGGQLDGPIALYSLELAAHSLGLGACWAGVVLMGAEYHPPLLELLQLPENHKCLGAMMIGYPKHEFHRIPVKKQPGIEWR